MTTLHFFPDKIHLLTWFKDSPNTGDPLCICSFCRKLIAEGEMPLRIFRDSDNTELRLHMECGQKVIVEMAPMPYRDHPAFADGRAAQLSGTRRGANPYPPGTGRAAWWAGWDDGWNKRTGAAGDQA